MTIKQIKMTTPKGSAHYPHLKRPDTHFHDQGIYKADLLVPKKDALPLMEKLAKHYKSITGSDLNMSKNSMFEEYVEKDSGKNSDQILFKMRIKNRLTKTGEVWDRRPKMFDSELTPIDVDPKGGSQMKVSFELYAWEASGKKGVSLQPVAVLITQLNTGQSDNASDYGFEKEDGYVAEKVETEFVDDPDVEDDEDGDF